MIRRRLLCLFLLPGLVGSLALRSAAEEAAEPAATVVQPSEATLPAVDAELDDDEWPEDALDPASRDGLECYNRKMFRFNELVLDDVMTPLARVFRLAVPRVGRDAIRRVFANLRQPVVFANDLLQLAPLQAAQTAARFLMNSTFGLGGLLDPATDVGFEAHTTGFGDTLALYGIPSGTYLVVPVAGPSTARDSIGLVVDVVTRPDTWLLGLGPFLLFDFAGGIATWEVEATELESLRSSSVDFYAALRAAYLLDREAHLRKRQKLVGWGFLNDPALSDTP